MSLNPRDVVDPILAELEERLTKSLASVHQFMNYHNRAKPAEFLYYNPRTGEEFQLSYRAHLVSTLYTPWFISYAVANDIKAAGYFYSMNRDLNKRVSDYYADAGRNLVPVTRDAMAVIGEYAYAEGLSIADFLAKRGMYVESPQTSKLPVNDRSVTHAFYSYGYSWGGYDRYRLFSTDEPYRDASYHSAFVAHNGRGFYNRIPAYVQRLYVNAANITVKEQNSWFKRDYYTAMMVDGGLWPGYFRVNNDEYAEVKSFPFIGKTQYGRQVSPVPSVFQIRTQSGGMSGVSIPERLFSQVDDNIIISIAMRSDNYKVNPRYAPASVYDTDDDYFVPEIPAALYINGELMTGEYAPAFIFNERNYVNVKTIMNHLGGTAELTDDIITLRLGGRTAIFGDGLMEYVVFGDVNNLEMAAAVTVTNPSKFLLDGSPELHLPNGERRYMDVFAMGYKGEEAYIPMYFIVDAFGLHAEYDEAERIIYVGGSVPGGSVILPIPEPDDDYIPLPEPIEDEDDPVPLPGPIEDEDDPVPLPGPIEDEDDPVPLPGPIEDDEDDFIPLPEPIW